MIKREVDYSDCFLNLVFMECFMEVTLVSCCQIFIPTSKTSKQTGLPKLGRRLVSLDEVFYVGILKAYTTFVDSQTAMKRKLLITVQ